jgi:acetyl-CoA synthetase
MEMSARWEWPAAAAAAGMSAAGIFNCGTVPLSAERAIDWVHLDGSVTSVSGPELTDMAQHISAVLADLGVGRGDRVAGLLSRRPETFATAMASWRLGAIYVPLYSGFGGEALRVRLHDSAPAVAVTDASNRVNLHAAGPALEAATIVDIDAEPVTGDLSLATLLEAVTAIPDPVDTRAGDPATLMYTSGSSGAPKGCIVPHHAIIGLRPYVEYCMEAGPGSVIFSGADPGWAYGLLTTGMAPIAMGATRVMYEGKFDPDAWMGAARAVGATHMATAPTGYRGLMGLSRNALPPQLRYAVSAGEPLDAPTHRWFSDVAGIEIRDGYGLTEVGMVAANLSTEVMGAPAAPGSFGVALPGYEVALVGDDGHPGSGRSEGRIAIRDNGFLMGCGYWRREAEWDARMRDGWFVTEDLARRDQCARMTYAGRTDDVIVTAGYNVGPLEVEELLLQFTGVLDAACVGKPDERKGMVVSVFVVYDGEPPPDLLERVRPWIGERIGWHAAPRSITVVDELPRTASGKLQRSRLRACQP